MEIGLLDKRIQYMKVKVIQESKKTEQIKANDVEQKRKALSSSLTNNTALVPNNNPLSPSIPSTSFNLANNNLTPMTLKGDNQRFIALIHNLIFYIYIKHIDIQYHYIKDQITIGRINL